MNLRTVRAYNEIGEWEGEYRVLGLRRPRYIYRDPANQSWYEARTGKHFVDCFLGFTRAMALERLAKEAEED